MLLKLPACIFSSLVLLDYWGSLIILVAGYKFCTLRLCTHNYALHLDFFRLSPSHTQASNVNINGSKMGEVDPVPKHIIREEYCEACHRISDFFTQSKHDNAHYNLDRALNKVCQKSRFEDPTEQFSEKNMLESCSLFIKRHREKIVKDIRNKQSNMKKDKEGKELTKWLCYDESWACIGVHRNKRKFEDDKVNDEELDDIKLSEFLKVHKDKVRRVNRVHSSADLKQQARMKSRHDEL